MHQFNYYVIVCILYTLTKAHRTLQSKKDPIGPHINMAVWVHRQGCTNGCECGIEKTHRCVLCTCTVGVLSGVLTFDASGGRGGDQ